MTNDETRLIASAAIKSFAISRKEFVSEDTDFGDLDRSIDFAAGVNSAERMASLIRALFLLKLRPEGYFKERKLLDSLKETLSSGL